MTTKTDITQERAAFEAWHERLYGRRPVRKGGGYAATAHTDRWTTWLACRAAVEADRKRRGEPVAWPKVNGVGRAGEHERSLVIYFASAPTDDQLRSVHEFLKDPQPAEPVKCPICYEDEPHTGTCGSSDPKALCNRAEPVKKPFLPDLKNFPSGRAEPVKVPSDAEIVALSRQMLATARTDNMIAFARALLSRYSSGQPAVCQECGGDGAGGLHEDDCSQNSSGLPAASAEPSNDVIRSFDEFSRKYTPKSHEEERLLRDRFKAWLRWDDGVVRYSDQPAASTGAPGHRKLREFYSVLTDDELIAAQQHHIEKLQTKLSANQDLFPGRVREG